MSTNPSPSAPTSYVRWVFRVYRQTGTNDTEALVVMESWLHVFIRDTSQNRLLDNRQVS